MSVTKEGSRMTGLCLLLLLAGCTPSKTEMLVRVFNDGLVIPSDVDTVYFRVTDMNGGVRREQSLQLCRPGGIGQGCFSFPITALLIPGDSEPDGDVAVEVDAVNSTGQTVIANAARFRFTHGTTQHIDFVLYPNCLSKVSCAVMYQVCLKNGTCGDPPTGPLDTDMDPKSDADLSVINLGDMAASVLPDLLLADLSLPVVDLSLTDLSTPSTDLSRRDLASVDLRLPHDLLQSLPDLNHPPADLCVPFCVPGTCGYESCGVPCLCGGGQTCSLGTCVGVVPIDLGAGKLDLLGAHRVGCGGYGDYCCALAPFCSSGSCVGGVCQ